jgi:hypothetical protein
MKSTSMHSKAEVMVDQIFSKKLASEYFRNEKWMRHKSIQQVLKNRAAAIRNKTGIERQRLIPVLFYNNEMHACISLMLTHFVINALKNVLLL